MHPSRSHHRFGIPALILGFGLAALPLPGRAALIHTIRYHAAIHLEAPYNPNVPPVEKGLTETGKSVEVYAESIYGKNNGFASALSETTGNMEVGAQVGGGDTFASAEAFQWHTITNAGSTPKPFRIDFELAPGEILIKNDSPIVTDFTPPYGTGAFSGTLHYQIFYSTDTQPTISLITDCRIDLISQNNDWNYGPGTNGCGFGLVDQTFDGQSDSWGVSTAGLSGDLELWLKPGENLHLDFSMLAIADKDVMDWPGLISSRFGDPLTPGGLGSITITSLDTQPDTVPEPGSAPLTGTALLALLDRKSVV